MAANCNGLNLLNCLFKLNDYKTQNGEEIPTQVKVIEERPVFWNELRVNS